MTIPTPLQTILCPVRYPFAVAQVMDGKIAMTMCYQRTLEQCYAETQGWRSANNNRATYIMAEQREMDGKSFWCAV
jgi:hypothetical protein